jgi:N-acetylneuraminic acid mutarotase
MGMSGLIGGPRREEPQRGTGQRIRLLSAGVNLYLTLLKNGPVLILLTLLPCCGPRADEGPEPPPPPPIDGWTWMTGGYLSDRVGVYGVKGQADPLNSPGGRRSAESWLDPDGHLWLFGGYAQGTQDHYPDPHNDLWKYDPAAAAWTWISGDADGAPNGIYGVKGVASPDNVPGGRQESASCTDKDGGLWLFGGLGPDAEGHWGELNDLWRFDTNTNEWTWVSGSDSFCQGGAYGIKGVASPNNGPGGRRCHAVWMDSSGKLWLFGGTGWDSIGELPGSLNDLWKFDPRTLDWTWVSGSDRMNAPASYGTQGLALPSNAPGGIGEAATWVDADDNLWLFGGKLISGALLNALWKFDTTSLEWTWVSGSDLVNQAGRYGTIGVASSANVPGGRREVFSWMGADGSFLLFGGYGYAATGAGYLNDMWRFNPAALEWTWVAGSSEIDQAGLYGTKGLASSQNFPGGRYGGGFWKNAEGELWLFGGAGYDVEGVQGLLNDLWRFHTLGPAPPPPTDVRVTLAPGAVSVNRTQTVQFHAKVHHCPNDAVVWSLSGDGCLGVSCGTISDAGLYTAPESVPDPATVTVTATSVADPSKSASATITIVDAPVIVTLSADAVTIHVGESVLFRAEVQHATNQDVVWSLLGAGCLGAACGTISDAGLYTAPESVPDPATVTVTATSVADPSKSASATVTILEAALYAWAWISGSDLANEAGVYGERGEADPSNVPGSRAGAASWTDLAGRLWLFGGWSDVPYYQGIYNDLWAYDPATREWTWHSGSSLVNRTGSYGTMGVPDPLNYPGARIDAAAWTGPDGDLWLFGGFGYGIDPNTAGELSDLWRYDIATGEWTWVSGNRGLYWGGYYGTKGIADPSNKPGGRQDAVSWTNADGRLWLFGGRGYDSSGHFGWLNDLWKYEIATNEWTWESGSDSRDPTAVYGVKGEPDPANIPGGRQSAVAWSDPQSRLWLFGGTGYDAAHLVGRLNDLWRYDTVSREWTWISGSDVRNKLGIYGARGVAEPSNAPGARYKAVSWIGDGGRLWLFGGLGYDAYVNGDRSLNDLWSFDLATFEWTWVSGSDAGNQLGVYGIRGVADPANTPGARREAVSWVDLHGHLWLFGGHGQASIGVGGVLNDLWKFYRQ